MKTWLEPVSVDVPDELQQVVGGHPLVAQTLLRRGIATPQAARAFLDADAYAPAPPGELPGLVELVERLSRAVTTGEPVLVWGDFDVDGQTATSLLVSGLSQVNAQVDYYIPLREGEGHGVQLESLRRRLDSAGMNGRGVLLTCDTGITANAAVEYAQRRGVDVLISDHHELPAVLPQAAAITNPRFLPDLHPLSSLPGVGVAYKIIEELFSNLGSPGAQELFLDLAALGVIADVAQLRGEARWLVQRGLAAMRRSPRAGLAALLDVAQVDPANLSEEGVSFDIAPRLNAVGRLGDANPAVELLITRDEGRAMVLAHMLENYNQQRRLLTHQVFQGAVALIEREPELTRQAALVLFQPVWEAGVLGIVASRLVERFGKPALLLSGTGGLARGSARSVAGINITRALESCAEMLHSYGGHAMAAGMSLPVDRLADFRQALSRAILAQGEIPEPCLQIDAYLELGDVNLELAANLERLAPFGAGNPTLVLAQGDLRLQRAEPFGKDSEHLRLQVTDASGADHVLIWWQGVDQELPEGAFDLAYSLRASSYKGKRQVQIEWLEHRPSRHSVVEIARRVEVAGDFRADSKPLVQLRSLLAADTLVIWAEGAGLEKLHELGIPALPRDELVHGDHLAIWTSPPSGQALGQVLRQVSPRYVYLFNVTPAEDDPVVFLRRLAGMARYALNHPEDPPQVSRLAAALAQCSEAVLAGLDWLAGRGSLVWQADSGGNLNLQAGGQSDAQLEQRALAAVKTLLDEARAYRKYYSRCPAASLIG